MNNYKYNLSYYRNPLDISNKSYVILKTGPGLKKFELVDNKDFKTKEEALIYCDLCGIIIENRDLISTP